MDAHSLSTSIPVLGEATYDSPLLEKEPGKTLYNFTDNNRRVVVDVDSERLADMQARSKTPPSFEVAGAREKIFFNPETLKCAVVTCGGLCPGLNDIIRAIVLELYYSYRVKTVFVINC